MKTKETKIAIELFITAKPNNYYNSTDENSQLFDYDVYTFDPTGFDHRETEILLYSEKTTITLPKGIDLIQKSVDSLHEQKQKLQAEYHVKKTNIEEKIANLMALEYKPEPEDKK